MTQATTGNVTADASHPPPHVIVIGAGFAGLYAVKGLRKGRFRVTLIDRNLVQHVPAAAVPGRDRRA